MTDDQRRRFEEVWPGLSHRLSARLAKRNVPVSLRDDVVQETGLRLLEMWPRVDPARPVWPLAITIAGNLLWDDVNRTRRHEVLGEVDEVAPGDVEDAAIARSELTEVSLAMRRLTDSQRAALLAEVGASDIATSVSADALKMLRLRARRRLAVLLQRVPAPAALWIRSRTWLGDLARVPEAPSALAGLALYAAILLAPSALLGFDDDARRPGPRTMHVPSIGTSAAPLTKPTLEVGSAPAGRRAHAATAGGAPAISVSPASTRGAGMRPVRPKPGALAPKGAYYEGRLNRIGPVSARWSASFSPWRERPARPARCSLPRRGSSLGCEANAPRVRVRAKVRIHR